jgi:hypothetical protein
MPMDEVSEKFPLYNLHTRAGKIYLDNLKSILRDGPIEDLLQFKGFCPNELIQLALYIQDILAKDLIPLKKKTLSPYHLQTCIETLDLFFDNQYAEGRFSVQNRFNRKSSRQGLLQ